MSITYSLTDLIETYRGSRLSQDFYSRNPETVAKELIGKTLVRVYDTGIIAGMITETEAYLSQGDLASHSAGGLTYRNASMFMDGGTIYVYKIYGMHFCVNAVTEESGIGSAVLLRALLPNHGIEMMAKNRNTNDIKKLCRGPGNLTRALGLDQSFDKKSFLSDNIFISSFNSLSNNVISTSKRIGITKSSDLKLRFSLI